MKELETSEKIGLAGVTSALLLVLWAVWYFCFAHPCLKYENYSCEVTRCAVNVPIINYGANNTTYTTWHCVYYETNTETCTRCIERKQ